MLRATAAGGLTVNTWADLLAQTSGPDGEVYTVRQPVCTGGTHGTQWVRTPGNLFRPAGQQLVFSSNVLVTSPGPTTDEQMLRSTLFAVGVLAGVRIFRSSTRFNRSAADPNNATMRDRLGLSGTSTDQLLSSNGASAGERQSQYVSRYSVLSDTEIAFRGLEGSTVVSLDTRGSSTAASSASTTLSTALSTSAFYYSVTYQQGATPAATISSPFCFIWVE